MASAEGPRGFGAASLRMCAIAVAYYAAAKLGLLVTLVGVVTPLWPPTGIALVGLLLMGVRMWPGIALGAVLVESSLGTPAAAVAAIVVGNTLAPVCACLLLRQVGFRIELDRFKDALALVFLGAFLGMLISATVGSGALVLSGAVPAGGFWPTWSVWWTGDATGVLVVAPLLLVMRTARLPRDIGPYRWAEAVALPVCTLVVTLLATRTVDNLLFLVFPCLLWAAFRFRLAGAAPCALIVSVLAVYAAAQKTGPFAHHDLFSTMVTLQAFNGTMALTALLPSVIITERLHTREELARLCAQLAEVVTRLMPGENITKLLESPPPPHRRPPDGESPSGGGVSA